MPEGHAIHRLANRINKTFAGEQTRSSSPQGRFAASAKIIDQRELVQAEAFGKHLFVSFDGIDEVVRVHLGIYGKWSFGKRAEVVGQVRWRLSDEKIISDLRGPSACELIDQDEVKNVLDRLGPDPIRSDSDPDRAWERISNSRAPIATLLMDQKVIAGVGNIYRAEVLFRNNLDPLTPGSEISREQFHNMWADLVELMKLGVKRGRIDTVRPEHLPEAMGRPPREDVHGGEVYVYRRTTKPCFVCGTKIETNKHAARNLFWCPKCQLARN